MEKEIEDHHKKSSLCASRPKYRDARWERAVKVYTINLESKFLLVQGVPALGVTKDLLETFAIYGTIDEYRILDDYPSDKFTKVYWIKFRHIMAARKAKRKLDNRSFFGGILHVSYAPEFESVEETKQKIMDRKRVVERKIHYSQKQSKSEQETDHEPQTSQRSRSIQSDSTVTCSRVHSTEIADNQSTASTSSMPATAMYENEPTHAIVNESPYPPQLPPFSVPTYPSQVPTMSTSLANPPHRNVGENPPSATAPPQQHYSKAQSGPVTSSSRKLYGYNTSVSFPTLPPNQRKGVSLQPPGDNTIEESLTGDPSLDRTVLSIREKLKRVNKDPIAETQATVGDKKKKQRKRI
ncbi:RNA-binding protein 48-like [Dendronephthya gigantea]|uniref:RNA-binding protein 48-like n=1 Tax=Dendronephthya gigantea TaxID=151771 RepID=UPI00106C58CB|nr:RNA-binding protein 48-like [Dendronephthya gigantea]XP_028394679.1 RNA-binding protein 48-like [Dendronephthya gigantea]XP_028394797.1 RNA-binding protein 48-like [Dendronephthya gigantea]